MTTVVELSIATTIYNSSYAIKQLIDEIEQTIKPLGITYEIIMVNDFSKDNSWQVIRDICKQNDHVKAISLSRNFGQQIAMSVGIFHSTGNYVVILDGDLQNPTSEIPALYNKIKEGYDIVYTVSKVRNNLFDELTSTFFYFLITKVLKINIVPNQLMFKIFTRELANRYSLYQEHSRIVADIVRDISDNYAELRVTNKKRPMGKSNYNYRKKFNFMLNFLFNITNAPLNLMFIFGLGVFIASFFFSIYKIIEYYFFDISPGYTSLLVSIWMFGGIVISCLGLLGKYLAAIYVEVKNRPLYFIADKINI